MLELYLFLQSTVTFTKGYEQRVSNYIHLENDENYTSSFEIVLDFGSNLKKPMEKNEKTIQGGV